MDKIDVINKFNRVLNNYENWGTGYWDNKFKGRVCTRHLFEDILKWSDTDYKNKLCKSTFIKNKLGTMVKRLYNDDFYEALMDAFPEKINFFLLMKNKALSILEVSDKSELALINEDIRKECLMRMISAKGYNQDKLDLQLSKYDFFEFGLKTVFSTIYDSKLENAVEDIFPGKYKPWQFYTSSIDSKELYRNGFWNNEHNREDAFMWLCKKVLDKGRTLTTIRVNDFKDNGLEMLLYYYQSNRGNSFWFSRKLNVFPIFEEFLPEEFRPWMFEEDGYDDYWINNKDFAKEALKYILEELEYSIKESNKLTRDIFDKYHLSLMLDTLYKGDIYTFVSDVVPETLNRWDFKDFPNNIWEDRSTRKSALMWILNQNGFKEDEVETKKESIAKFLKKETFYSYGFDYLIDTVYKKRVSLLLTDLLPNVFTEDMFINIEPNYKRLFGEYEEVKLLELSDDDIIFNDEEYSKMFAYNPNSWASRAFDMNPYYLKTGELVKYIIDGNIKIFKYKMKEPDEPKSEENHIFNFLWDYSRAKYSYTAWLYWRAYNFFEEKGFSLEFPSNTVYMSLTKKRNILNNYGYPKIHQFGTLDEKEFISNVLGVNTKTVVRCGELDIGRLMLESMHGADYFWLIPFAEENEQLYAYLFEINITYK